MSEWWKDGDKRNLGGTPPKRRRWEAPKKSRQIESFPSPPRCSPPSSDWESLRQPLTPGERLVADSLLKGLSQPWEVFLQPHLNGLMPDFVLLHPERGIVILEVKDWSGPGPDVRSFRKAIGTARVRIKEVSELYCPDLGYRYQGRVAHRLVLPFLSRAALDSHLQQLPSWKPADYIGKEGVEDSLSDLVDEALPKSSCSEVSEATTDLRRWCSEPEFVREQRRKLRLDSRQLRLLREDPARRVIHGPAGSGKSQVLAARAAKLAGEGKRVLVLTFNITLLNYLRDLAVRAPEWKTSGRDIRDNIVWLNFHQWCKRTCVGGGLVDEYKALWEHTQKALDSGVAELQIRALSNGSPESRAYDAILVDEAQDFAQPWIEALPLALKEEGQLWVAVDLTQDIYSRGEGWPRHLFRGLGFGRPAKLEASYRLDPKVSELARSFAGTYLKGTFVETPAQSSELELDLMEGPALRWIQAGEGADLAAVFFQELWKQLPRVHDPAVAELTFLCGSHKLGLDITTRLEEKGVHVRHTFSADGNPPMHQKMAFFKGDTRVKGTTIHSYKGWESRVLLLHVPKGRREESMRRVYTGMTRLLRCSSGSALTVVCEEPNLEPFGRTWPDFEVHCDG